MAKPPHTGDQRALDGHAHAGTGFEHRPVDEHADPVPVATTRLTDAERVLLGDLFAVVEEHADEAAEEIDRKLVERAFEFSCERHADQRRASGEDFIVHPIGVAKICAGMRLDTATLCAALLHDTVEDTSASLDEVREEFGDEIAQLVDGVTKLSGVTFQSRDDRQAENYRKMLVAMAQDIRVILIKLADRLHNMRTLSAMPKPKQQEKAKETIEIFAPLAHRLGIHAIKWELEDLAFATLHPRKFNEIKQLVSQQREEREAYVARAGEYLTRELEAVGIKAQISGRAKHFYSIYSKMTKKGREFNEIYDLTAMRVIVDSVKDCYGAIGVIHSVWKPLPGRFKDWVAMPKFNMYQALHTTVIGPEGRPLEIQIRTMEMHRTAEFGVAAHWIYKEDGGRPVEQKVEWLRHLLDWQQELADPQEFAETLKADLFEDEVFVFTPKGEVKSLGAGATPLDFAYEIHTDVGHRCVGAKVNGKIVPLHYELQSGDICEVLTSKKERGPSRDWLALAKTTRAQSKIRAWFKRERREDSERTGREILQDNLKRAGL
ncbi:MAG TPA: bifunctional (p)ppGpp synthetase/guanosine-3',5'-bis(diphosphate) 3'-pyrophosphohydrolase, partial [Thermoleophilaceae bacterium]|nr:bifunctional (p)ppGpp synthetase/guanosine-3',5'-bis(diphosphate) 3'-pyrophosphohydrolase [Thermoleophilaceae bacterium]